MGDATARGVEGTPGVEHRVLTIEGSPLSFYAAGDPGRPAVVLLHGAMFDEARFVWDQLFPVLAERFRVVAIDLPRHGRSRPWPGHVGHERLMRVLHSAVEQLGLRRFSIVGLSMGGGVALKYASLHPDRVERMVLFEPGGLAERLDKQFLTWLYTRTPGLGRIVAQTLHRQGDARLSATLDKLFVGGSHPTDPCPAHVTTGLLHPHPPRRHHDPWQRRRRPGGAARRASHEGQRNQELKPVIARFEQRHSGLGWVDAIERCGNRRHWVERLVSAWNQGSRGDADLAGEADDPLIGASVEPKKRPRTRLTDEEVNAMRTARANGTSVNVLAGQFGVHRGTVWAKTRDVSAPAHDPSRKTGITVPHSSRVPPRADSLDA